MPLANLPPIREVIRAHGLSADKRFGQHFLTDPNILSRIAAAAEPLNQGTIIEIGPGPGGLTRALLERGASRLIVIEIDPRCAEIAREIAEEEPRLTVIEGDALEIDVEDLGPPPRKIVANLPYNIATPLLIKWLRTSAYHSDAINLMTLMFQREVADRLLAKPGQKTYGRLSVLTQWRTIANKVMDLPAGAFTPPPKVRSSVINLNPLPALDDPDLFQAMERTTAAAFGQRRKMLRQSLKAIRNSEEILKIACLDGSRRAETLSTSEFVALATAAR
ncbi:MAG: 16S rRNA (adenine(1518)-N(6)/adenine(1519)-N(6))-dimethyltransferase RsmA [Alphaproteobacteria bacterium]|jgi:16S rRNA (adenine1518-N6/adenine1519-N6)-dimethyltransferase